MTKRWRQFVSWNLTVQSAKHDINLCAKNSISTLTWLEILCAWNKTELLPKFWPNGDQTVTKLWKNYEKIMTKCVTKLWPNCDQIVIKLWPKLWPNCDWMVTKLWLNCDKIMRKLWLNLFSELTVNCWFFILQLLCL